MIQLSAMKRDYIGNSGAYTSPGTPEYGDDCGGGVSKGWSSERVPFPANSSRRHIGGGAGFTPFNSGRALPSKWDDAERWITSPVSGYGPPFKSLAVQPQRRPKSKSGPLGPPGVMCLTNYSPSVPTLEGGNGRNFMAGSPFTTGVLVPDAVSVLYNVGNGGESGSKCDEGSVSLFDGAPGLSHLVTQEDDKLDESKESEAAVSRVVSRRDMATQMSPESSGRSSCNARLSFSAFPSVESPIELRSDSAVKVEVKDVQVDKSATNTSVSKKHGPRKMRKRSSEVKDLGSPWDVGDYAKNASKLQREDAKITAWENLQKAKAEAAIHKLEMKLEKKKSASMDKILGKLKAAEMKAQEMRSSITENQFPRPPGVSHKISFCKYVRISSLFRCFLCSRW